MKLLREFPNLKVIKEMASRKKLQIFLVGGFVRDQLLKREKLDFDFAVDRDALKLAKQFATKIKGAYIILDKEHGCARVAKKTKGIVATYDFADFRAKTIKGDLNHRDFTINSLSMDLLKVDDQSDFFDMICDHKNGFKDLKAKTIRMTQNKVFKEDPLRMLRAFSLKAMLNFKIDSATITQIKKDKDLIVDVSPERVREELFKILLSDRAAKTLKELDKIGLLQKIIPQIAVMYRCKQGTYHHLDVWPHSLETVVQMEGVLKEMQNDDDICQYIHESFAGERTRASIMKLAALLHDIGKPDTRKKERDRISFHGHEHVGKRIVTHIAKMLKLSTKERHALEDMVVWHLRPGYLSNFKKPSEKAIFRYLRDTKDEAASVTLLSLADQRATRGPATTEKDQKHHEKICLQVVKKYFDKKKEKPFVRLINGDDLIKKLKLKPSPLFAKILADVEEAQVLGKIKTKTEAIELAKTKI